MKSNETEEVTCIHSNNLYLNPCHIDAIHRIFLRIEITTIGKCCQMVLSEKKDILGQIYFHIPEFVSPLAL